MLGNQNQGGTPVGSIKQEEILIRSRYQRWNNAITDRETELKIEQPVFSKNIEIPLNVFYCPRTTLWFAKMCEMHQKPKKRTE